MVQTIFIGTTADGLPSTPALREDEFAQVCNFDQTVGAPAPDNLVFRDWFPSVSHLSVAAIGQIIPSQQRVSCATDETED
jgi:hypothetical protein